METTVSRVHGSMFAPEDDSGTDTDDDEVEVTPDVENGEILVQVKDAAAAAKNAAAAATNAATAAPRLESAGSDAFGIVYAPLSRPRERYQLPQGPAFDDEQAFAKELDEEFCVPEPKLVGLATAPSTPCENASDQGPLEGIGEQDMREDDQAPEPGKTVDGEGAVQEQGVVSQGVAHHGLSGHEDGKTLLDGSKGAISHHEERTSALHHLVDTYAGDLGGTEAMKWPGKHLASHRLTTGTMLSVGELTIEEGNEEEDGDEVEQQDDKGRGAGKEDQVELEVGGLCPEDAHQQAERDWDAIALVQQHSTDLKVPRAGGSALSRGAGRPGNGQLKGGPRLAGRKKTVKKPGPEWSEI